LKTLAFLIFTYGLISIFSAVATAFQTISMLIAPAIGSLFAKLIGASIILLVAGGATWLMGVIVLLFIVKRINHSKKIKGEFNN